MNVAESHRLKAGRARSSDRDPSRGVWDFGFMVRRRVERVARGLLVLAMRFRGQDGKRDDAKERQLTRSRNQVGRPETTDLVDLHASARGVSR